MFAAAELCTFAPPSTASSTVRPRGRRPVLIVPRRSPFSCSLRPVSLVAVASSKKLRGRRRPPPRGDRSAFVIADEEEETDLAEIGPYPRSDVAQPDTVTVSQPDKGNEGGAPLRGLDVLKALQKASAQKGRGTGRKGRRRGGGPRNNGKGGDGENSAYGGAGARPLEIKEDWWPRMEALEKQIQEVQEEQYGH